MPSVPRCVMCGNTLDHMIHRDPQFRGASGEIEYHEPVNGGQQDDAPLHPFEIQITIGANTWEYARRAAQQIADYIEEREPKDCGCASGGWDGGYSIDVTQRDITPDAFRDELEAWRQRQVAAK